MIKKVSYVALCLAFFLIISCVSKNKYVELENKMNETQAQLEEDKNNLQTQNNKLLGENKLQLPPVLRLYHWD